MNLAHLQDHKQKFLSVEACFFLSESCVIAEVGEVAVSALTVAPFAMPKIVKPINTEAAPTVNLRIEKTLFFSFILRKCSDKLFLDNISFSPFSSTY
jgi:hypothetical protein